MACSVFDVLDVLDMVRPVNDLMANTLSNKHFLRIAGAKAGKHHTAQSVSITKGESD